MNTKFYTIRCITNMHMGNGDINFNIIDNEVQRDPITNMPCMFSSSIKGALREHFKTNESIDVQAIFGNEIGASSSSGKVKFLSANLLMLPVRASKGNLAYCMVTTVDMLKNCENLMNTLGKNIALSEGLEKEKNYGPRGIEVDGLNLQLEALPDNSNLKAAIENLCGKEVAEKLVVLSEENIKKINLPVLARNYLENGISKNLWYEEVVPHEAVFYTAVLSDGTTDGDAALTNFDGFIKTNKLVQFGGNASIGYGLTEVKEVN